MKKILLIILVLVSVQSFGQMKKKYAENLNTNGTIDSFYVKLPVSHDSIFNYAGDGFVERTLEYYVRQNLPLPAGFSLFHLDADGVYRNFTQRTSTALSGTNTGNDAPNTLYSGLAASKQDALGFTALPNTTTSGVAASPTASGTQTITHNLGRVPTIIRIYGIGTFTANAAATPTPFSMGLFSSSGNTCVYMRSTGITTQVSQTSIVFSVFISTTSGNFISGVIQNVTSTSFDIQWSETGTATAQNFLWESQ